MNNKMKALMLGTGLTLSLLLVGCKSEQTYPDNPTAPINGNNIIDDDRNIDGNVGFNII
ncbi:MAG: hypothetical protein N4A50_05225 [Vallitalea sp.]|nr:hypothetical protein [Vallitalea sp.]